MVTIQCLLSGTPVHGTLGNTGGIGRERDRNRVYSRLMQMRVLLYNVRERDVNVRVERENVVR
jgi:hypothetical protein